ncbi:hypothetical protein [Paucibacter sp. DJ1R-11]|nr:hypothetical protein [Paucibacter sp. DJ1R-11]
METELELSPEFPSPSLYDDVHKRKPRKACTKLPAGLAEKLLIW